MLITVSVSAQSVTETANCVFEQKFSFKFGKADFDPAFKDNMKGLDELDQKLSEIDLDRIETVDIVAVSSPEGSFAYNVYLSKHRCESARSYFTSRYPELAERMSFSWKDEAWDGLRTMVENDGALSGRSKQRVLAIIDDDSISIDTRKWRMEHTPVYKYIKANIYPELRSTLVCIITYRRAEMEMLEPIAPVSRKAVVMAIDTLKYRQVMQAAPVVIETPARKFDYPPFALKTNLLADVAGAFNGEIEIPVGPRWSVDAEWMAPWWLSRKNTWCYEMLSFTAEGRYWLGDRQEKEMLQGWFTSVYANTGKYDFQNREKGMQGVFWNAGVGCGYAWNIGKGWGMEAMLGIGYLHTRYEQYNPKEDYSILAYRQTLKTQWFGPTRAKLSIYYKFGQRWYNRKYRGIDE